MANPSATDWLKTMAQQVRDASPSQLSATGRSIRESFEKAMQLVEHSRSIDEASDSVDNEWRAFMRALEQAAIAGTGSTPELKESRKTTLAAIERLSELVPDPGRLQ